MSSRSRGTASDETATNIWWYPPTEQHYSGCSRSEQGALASSWPIGGSLKTVSNTCVNLTVEERCSSVPSALRAPTAGYADR